MQRAIVTTSPVDEEDWHNGHTRHNSKHSPPPPTLAQPLRSPSLSTNFPTNPLHSTASPTPSPTDHYTPATKQENALSDTAGSQRPLTNGSSAHGASLLDAAPRPYVIYSLSSPSDPVGVVDCSPLSSLTSLRHLILDELVSELGDTSFVFLYRGVKLTERQEQVKTVSNIAQRVDGSQADEAVYIRYSNTAAPDQPHLSSSAAPYSLPAGLPPLVGAGSSAVSSSTRLSYDQLSYLELLKLRDAPKQQTSTAAVGALEVGQPRRKRGRPPKRRLDENGTQSSDSVKRERLSAPPVMQLTPPTNDTQQQPPLIPPPTTASDALSPDAATFHSNGQLPSSHVLLPLLGSPPVSSMQVGSPKRRYRRTHAALMASWLAGDRGVKRCFTCGRVMTTGQQKQHRCDMEPEERQTKWRAEREELMRQKVGGEIVIVGADTAGSDVGTAVGLDGGTDKEKEDGRRTRWRKVRAQREEEARRRATAAIGNGTGLTEEKDQDQQAEMAEDGEQSMRQDDDQDDSEGGDGEGEDEDGEHDSVTEDEEDDLDDLPPLLQAQAAMDAVQAVSGGVKMERGDTDDR